MCVQYGHVNERDTMYESMAGALLGLDPKSYKDLSTFMFGILI